MTYIDLVLNRVDTDGIQKAIQDYDTAISLDPGLASAYNDKGVALAHQALYDDDRKPDEQIHALEHAIDVISKAIEITPESPQAYLNCAYIDMEITYLLEDNDQAIQSHSQELVDFSDHVIKIDPENLWGYLLRSIGFERQLGVEKDAATWDKMQAEADESYLKYQALKDTSGIGYELEALFRRILTLSIGPEIVPPNFTSNISGQIYTSPDDSFSLDFPKLMQPNAISIAVQASSGDLLILFSDDIGRMITLQSHPGSVGRQTLMTWTQDNLANQFHAGAVKQIQTQNGPAVQFSYRDDNLTAECEMIVLTYDRRIYTAGYCLKDAGSDEILTDYRAFAQGYDITYEPVDVMVNMLMDGLQFLPNKDNLSGWIVYFVR